MTDPWAKFRVQGTAPAPQDDPWAVFRIQAQPQAAPEPAPAPSIPKVGDVWIDPETGEQKRIVEPSLSRKPGEYTLADVEGRMASLAKGSPQLPSVGNLGPTAMGPADIDAQAEAARSDEFTQRVLANTNDANATLTQQILGSQRASDRSALETGVREAVNTFGIGLPRLASSAMSTTPLAVEHEIQKAADAAGRVAHPRAAQNGQMAGVIGQVAATPAAAVATPTRAALAGALLSGGQTAVDTRGDVKETLKDAAKGGALGLMGNMLIGAPQASSRSFIMENAPSREALKQFADEGYAAARQSGVQYAAKPVSDATERLAKALQADGFRPLNQPKTFNVLSEMHDLAGKPIGIDDLESIRRAAQNVASDPSERAAARRIRSAVDDLTANTRPEDVLAGDPVAAAAAIRDGRANTAAMKRSDLLTDAIRQAELQVEASGGSIDAALRQKFKSVLTNQEKLRGFSPEEIAAIEKVVRGGTVQNAARTIGKVGAGSPISAALMTGLGVATYGPGAMAIPVVGGLAKRYSEKAATQNAAFTEALTRARAPAYDPVVEALLSSVPTRHLPPKTQLLAQTLMAQPNLVSAR